MGATGDGFLVSKMGLKLCTVGLLLSNLNNTTFKHL